MAIDSVVNGTTIIINEQVSYDWIGIIIASIVAVITLVGIILTNRRTKESNNELKKSNNLLKMELINNLRPKLKLSEFPKQLKKPPQYHEYDFDFRFNNIGSMPIHNLKVYCWHKEEDKINAKGLRINDLISNEKIIKKNIFYQSITTLMPNEQIHPQKYLIYEEKAKSYISMVLWVTYDFLEANEHEEIIWDIGYSDFTYTGHGTYITSDIQKTRKELGTTRPDS